MAPNHSRPEQPSMDPPSQQHPQLSPQQPEAVEYIRGRLRETEALFAAIGNETAISVELREEWRKAHQMQENVLAQILGLSHGVSQPPVAAPPARYHQPPAHYYPPPARQLTEEEKMAMFNTLQQSINEKDKRQHERRNRLADLRDRLALPSQRQPRRQPFMAATHTHASRQPPSETPTGLFDGGYQRPAGTVPRFDFSGYENRRHQRFLASRDANKRLEDMRNDAIKKSEHTHRKLADYAALVDQVGHEDQDWFQRLLEAAFPLENVETSPDGAIPRNGAQNGAPPFSPGLGGM